MTTKTRTVEDLLRDAAFALRMARKISIQIRDEAAAKSEVKRPQLTDETPTVTLGA